MILQHFTSVQLFRSSAVGTLCPAQSRMMPAVVRKSLDVFSGRRDRDALRNPNWASSMQRAPAMSMPAVKIRPAALRDVPTLTRWDGEQHVITATSDDPSVPDKFDWNHELAPRADGTQFFVAEVEERPIGILGVLDPARERTHYWGAVAVNLRAIDIWIGEKDALGKGYGSQMMKWAIDYCFAEPNVVAIVVDPLYSNTRAHRFYEKFGFRRVERRQFDAISDCLVMRLEKGSYDAR